MENPTDWIQICTSCGWRHKGDLIEGPCSQCKGPSWLTRRGEVFSTNQPEAIGEIATVARILATTNFAAIPSCQKSEEVSGYSFGELSASMVVSGHQPKRLRGRPKSDAPIAEIKKLGKRGLRAKAIASRLKAEGRLISYRSVHRILVGERK